MFSGFVAELDLVMWNLLDLRVYSSPVFFNHAFYFFIYLFILIVPSHMPYYGLTSPQWPPGTEEVAAVDRFIKRSLGPGSTVGEKGKQQK